MGTSFVHSRLDFCNSLFYGLPKTQLNRFQHIQNSLVRAVVAGPGSSDADLILKSLHWLRVPERIKYIIAPLLISFSSIPLYSTFVISSLSSLPGPPDPHQWSLSFARSLSLDSKSPIALSATQHPISGTDFLHHLDYHVPPLHPPVVLHSLDLLLACHVRCSTLVSKLTFSPGPFLHSFSQ